MNTRNLMFLFVLLFALIVAACSPQATPVDEMADKEASSSETMMEEKEDEAMMEDKSDSSMMDEKKDDSMMDDKDDEMMSDKDEGMDAHQDDSMMDEKKDDSMMEEKDDAMSGEMMLPEWQKATLTNARTGETFAIADFKGKVVLVETLAMWCSNCLKQQGQVQALHDLIGDRDDFISLGIDIDPNENAEALQAYTDKNGFDWLYTVAPTEVSREIGQLYGAQYLNPPSTPMLIVDREGEVHLLPFGIKSAESLLEALQPFLDGEM